VSVLLIYSLTTRWVPGYPVSYPVGYSGNELPDNGIPNGDSDDDDDNVNIRIPMRRI